MKNSARPGAIHVEAARAAVSKDIADLQVVINSTDDLSLLSALITLGQDAQKDAAAFVLLRRDLGLPPSESSPSPTKATAPNT